MYSYDRRDKTALLSEGPVGQVLIKWWNIFHDVEHDLKKAQHDYDWAASYADGPGQKDAQAMMRQIETALKELRGIADSGGLFDDLAKAEGKFTDKHGPPAMYIRGQQEKMGLR